MFLKVPFMNPIHSFEHTQSIIIFSVCYEPPHLATMSTLVSFRRGTVSALAQGSTAPIVEPILLMQKDEVSFWNIFLFLKPPFFLSRHHHFSVLHNWDLTVELDRICKLWWRAMLPSSGYPGLTITAAHSQIEFLLNDKVKGKGSTALQNPEVPYKWVTRGPRQKLFRC